MKQTDEITIKISTMDAKNADGKTVKFVSVEKNGKQLIGRKKGSGIMKDTFEFLKAIENFENN